MVSHGMHPRFLPLLKGSHGQTTPIALIKRWPSLNRRQRDKTNMNPDGHCRHFLPDAACANVPVATFGGAPGGVAGSQDEDIRGPRTTSGDLWWLRMSSAARVATRLEGAGLEVKNLGEALQNHRAAAPSGA